MGRTIHKLTHPAITALKKAGRVGDGGGLYLNVSPTFTKSWLFLWTPRGGSRREMGLGSYPAVTLAKARALAADCRSAVAEGRDPIAERDQTPEPTFEDAAELFIASVESEWRNEKHRWQWRQTITAHCTPINAKRVSKVTTEDVLAVLKPIWTKLPETAARLRGRIERILNFCKVKGWRSPDSINPAAWAGHLENLLPRRSKLSRGHQAAMPYEAVPAFVARLRTMPESLSAQALELTILAAARTGEAIGMQWREVDLDKALWTIPPERMKAGKPHVVPLVPRAVEILRELAEAKAGPYVFPSLAKAKPKAEPRPMSNMAMLMLLRRMMGEGEAATVHGFRSSFRDWAGDHTSFPREVAEAALAHSVGNEVEQAYRRSTALDKRRKLMEAWARYVGSSSADGKVIPMVRPV